MRNKTSYNTTFISGKYYLYRHIRLDKNEPFYIGIGTRQRGHNCKSIYLRAYAKANRSSFWKNITAKTGYNIEIIYETNSIPEIKQKEIEFIHLYGRKESGGVLCNMTDGGDGLNTSKEAVNKRKITMQLNGEKEKNIERLRQLNMARLNNQHKFNEKEIFVYDLLGTFLKKCISVKECCNEFNISESGIAYSIKGKRSTKKYIFSFYSLGADISYYEIISNKEANCAASTKIYNTIDKKEHIFKTRKSASLFMGMTTISHISRALKIGFYKHFKVMNLD